MESAGAKTAVGFERLPARGVDDRLIRGGDRQIRPASGRGASVLVHTNGSSRLPIRLPEPVNLDLGLVWRTGQAGICMLDRERDQLRPIVDPTRGQSARRPRAVRKGQREDELHFATRHLRAGVRFRGQPPVASDIRAFDTVLSSMRHHQVLCLVLHACCLSVLSACCLRDISVATPSKPLVRGFLVKNCLRIVNKTIVVNFACVVIPDVPQ